MSVLVSDGLSMILDCDNESCRKRVMRLCKVAIETSLTAPSGRKLFFCGQECFDTYGPIERNE